ncbi:hypothetical protein TRSC58_03117 [Trypanosoma rangeli SC58]|uniref:Stress-associated endoplasmic reticulum protein n=1 Tax=Trypanosoma rangeli SC58 TaxID=429131 RepID=A0A061J7B1_TRYRA|nr:hypothetical protein TRSC58_03117 [Trypanosoma rangeli SC58]
MPMSPARTMRAKAQKQNDQIRFPRPSGEEKKRSREAKENKTPVSTWISALMLFIIFGSTIVHIYINIVSSPKVGKAN